MNRPLRRRVGALGALGALLPGVAAPGFAGTAAQAATGLQTPPPDYQYGSLQAEATGRQAVELTGQGQYVSISITLPSGTSDRYVEFDLTANNVQNGAQVAELDVYA